MQGLDGSRRSLAESRAGVHSRARSTTELIYRFVAHHRVHDYLNVGWHIASADIGHHSAWSVLMHWPCDCKMVEPH
jgi:hypothetical protein